MRYGILIALFIIIFSAHAEVGYKVGNTAPGFSLKTLDNTEYSLAALRKKGHVFLAFWAVECVYCYAHIKEFNHAHEKYKGKLTVAAINIGGEYPPEVAEYVKDNNVKYLVLSERLKNLDVGEKYRVLGTPTLVLISPEGKILFYGHKMPDLSRWIK